MDAGPIWMLEKRGYSFVDEHSADGKEISDTELPDGIDWTGAVIHLKNIRWSMINREVDASSGITLTLNKKFSCVISNLGDCIGWGYFINNHFGTLDQDGEWYYDADERKVYLVSTVGPPQNIEASVVLDEFATLRHGGILLSDGSATAYVVIDNLAVKNWFNHGIDTPGGMTADIYHHITLRNLSIKDVDSCRCSCYPVGLKIHQMGTRVCGAVIISSSRIIASTAPIILGSLVILPNQPSMETRSKTSA